MKFTYYFSFICNFRLILSRGSSTGIMQIKQTNWLHCAPLSLSLLLLSCSCCWSCAAAQLLRIALYVIPSLCVCACVWRVSLLSNSVFIFSYILRCSFHDFGSRFDSCHSLPLSLSLPLLHLQASAAANTWQTNYCVRVWEILLFLCVICPKFLIHISVFRRRAHWNLFQLDKKNTTATTTTHTIHTHSDTLARSKRSSSSRRTKPKEARKKTKKELDRVCIFGCCCFYFLLIILLALSARSLFLSLSRRSFLSLSVHSPVLFATLRKKQQKKYCKTFSNSFFAKLLPCFLLPPSLLLHLCFDHLLCCCCCVLLVSIPVFQGRVICFHFFFWFSLIFCACASRSFAVIFVDTDLPLSLALALPFYCCTLLSEIWNMRLSFVCFCASFLIHKITFYLSLFVVFLFRVSFVVVQFIFVRYF